MLLMIESGIRGGIATISHRQAKAITNIWKLSSIVLRILTSSHI